MRIGVIGFGNMASAMIFGLFNHSDYHGTVYVSAKNYDKLKEKITGYNIIACKNNEEVIDNSDFIILGVKPYYVEEVLKPLKKLLINKTLYSIVAGYSFAALKELLDESTKVLSSIPNTPILVGKGIIICEENTDFSSVEKTFFEDTFSQIALIEYVSSANLSIAGTITGCTPAFIDLLIEALSDAAVMNGLPREISYRLISSMVEGSGKLQNVTNIHPGILKDQVCSPKGSTIVGVTTLEKHGFRYALIEAINNIQNK